MTVLHQNVIELLVRPPRLSNLDVAMHATQGVNVGQALRNLEDDLTLLLIRQAGTRRLGRVVRETPVRLLQNEHGTTVGRLRRAVQADAVRVGEHLLDVDLAVQRRPLVARHRLEPLLHRATLPLVLPIPHARNPRLHFVHLRERAGAQQLSFPQLRKGNVVFKRYTHTHNPRPTRRSTREWSAMHLRRENWLRRLLHSLLCTFVLSGVVVRISLQLVHDVAHHVFQRGQLGDNSHNMHPYTRP